MPEVGLQAEYDVRTGRARIERDAYEYGYDTAWNHFKTFYSFDSFISVAKQKATEYYQTWWSSVTYKTREITGACLPYLKDEQNAERQRIFCNAFMVGCRKAEAAGNEIRALPEYKHSAAIKAQEAKEEAYRRGPNAVVISTQHFEGGRLYTVEIYDPDYPDDRLVFEGVRRADNDIAIQEGS